MGNYESKKRTRPCLSCKRQKLKCQYDRTLPCERCAKHGIECYFPPSVKQKAVNSQTIVEPVRILEPQSQHQSQPLIEVPNLINSMIRTPNTQLELATNPSAGFPTVVVPKQAKGSSGSIEQRLEVLQNALESVLGIFQQNQIQHEQQVNLLQAQLRLHAKANHTPQPSGSVSAVSLPSLSQIIREDDDQVQVTDFRKDDVLTSSEAGELLHIFCTKMSAHLFGYNFEKLTLLKLWKESPLLLAAICTVACPHHPKLHTKKGQLQASLQWFTSRLMNAFDTIEDDEGVERTILGLVIASLWLDSNQMYMSIALQLARKWRLDQRFETEDKGELWKMWYLLYIADGSLNLTSRKSPSIYKQMEPTIALVREALVAHVRGQSLKDVLRQNEIAEDLTNQQLLSLNEVGHSKIKVEPYALQNMHLCALVEYHTAIELLFHNTNSGSMRAMSRLLKPHVLGIPWETNMDLDRWMISWTITLQNIDVQNDAWCLKSTLLYYNFARMHINTHWLKDREVSLDDSSWMEVWKNASKQQDESVLLAASHDVSYSAATSLLKLATKDKDIKSLFQFLPNHIYLMLFYACMIVLEPPSLRDCTDSTVIKKLRQSFKLVRTFRDMLVSHTATDSVLTKKIADNISSLMINFINACAEQMKKSALNDQRIEEIIQDTSDAAVPESAIKTISAWPSVNHGHP